MSEPTVAEPMSTATTIVDLSICRHCHELITRRQGARVWDHVGHCGVHGERRCQKDRADAPAAAPEPRSTPGPSTGTPEPSQAASEAHSDLTQAMREWGQAMRGDWGGVDGRSVRDVVDNWADEIDGKRLPRSIEARRAELDLCPHGLAHWTIWCEDDCAAIAADASR